MPSGSNHVPGSNYKWIALSNTTLGVLMATINSSIVLIALPDIFRGIGLNPLQPGNTTILLWMIMGFLVVTSVLVVSFGRLGDMFGRVRMYNAGFAVFALFSIMLSVTWLHGTAGGWYLIAMRIFQGVGGAMLTANSAAIITDAFPSHQRGLALGFNQVAGIAGSFIGLVLGGVLGPAGRESPRQGWPEDGWWQGQRRSCRVAHRAATVISQPLRQTRPKPGYVLNPT